MMADNDSTEASEARSLPARLRRLLRSVVEAAGANRKRAAIIAGLALASVAVFGTLIFMLSGSSPETDRPTLEAALAAWEQEDFVEARSVAQSLLLPGALPVSELGGPLFVLGAVSLREADLVWGYERRTHYLLAARYLEEARDRGWPASYQAQGLQLLAEALLASGQAPAARLALQDALEADPADVARVHYLLSEAHLADSGGDLAAALEHNRAGLEDGRLQPALRDRLWIQQAEIHLRQGDAAAAREAATAVTNQSPLRSEQTLLHARILIAEARQMRDEAEQAPADPPPPSVVDRFRQAIELLRQAQGLDVLGNDTTPKAMYWIAECYAELGDDRAAIDQLDRTSQMFPQSPHDLAARLLKAEILKRKRQDDDAIETLRAALAIEPTFSEGESAHGVGPGEIRKRLLGIYGTYFESEQYALATRMAELLRALTTDGTGHELEGRARRAWGRAMLLQAETQSPPESTALEESGRFQLRQAGEAFFLVARARLVSRGYPDQLWNAAESYLAGHDFANAAKILTTYLGEGERRRRPVALVGLGEAQLALDRPDEALSTLQTCVDFHPQAPSTFQARILASYAHQELDQPNEAEQRLLENLADERLTPASLEWRQSLIELGKLLYLRGRYDEAIVRLDEAVGRYPEDPRVAELRYLAAISLRQLGLQLAAPPGEDVPASAYAAREAESLAHLDAAAVRLLAERDALVELETERALTPREKVRLRNCYFAAGATLIALDRQQEAIDVFTQAVNRYGAAPESLEAYVQISHCFQQLGRPQEARGSLEQAKVVLAKIDEDVDLRLATNFDRPGWTQRLEWLSTL